ncbi:hypothetical protein ACIPPS_08485 [Streptomyces sp. NPDC090127]|uniref:hypothetical protein n=1 Tax=Streptomyces sp. NPDC090127 TaxID=3365953 RepID=UPI0037F46CAB
MRTSGMRATGALAHLLLVVVLALGVFVMHAFGHPKSASATGAEQHMTHGAPASGAERIAHGASATGAEQRLTHGAASAPDRGPVAPRAGSEAPDDSGAHGDMATLCVAVLGVWALARVVLAALGLHLDRLVRLLGRLLPALGPNAPPPRPPDLAQLSVLRI